MDGPMVRLPRDSRGPGRGRQGAWLEAGRRALLFLEYAGIGMDTLAAAGRLLRRENEALSRMADRKSLRGQGLHRREFRLRQYRGLLPHTLGAGLRTLRQIRPRVHRPRSAGKNGRRTTSQEGYARPRQRVGD